MKPSGLTEFDYFLAWMAFVVISVVVGFTVGGIGGFIIGFFLALIGLGQYAALAGGAFGLLFGLPLNYVLFRLIVAKLVVAKAHDTTVQGAVEKTPSTV